MSEAEKITVVEGQPTTAHKFVLWLEIPIWNDLNWSPVPHREKTARVAVVNTDALVPAGKHVHADADTTDEEAEEEQEAEVDDAEILSDLPDDIDVSSEPFNDSDIYSTLVLMS